MYKFVRFYLDRETDKKDNMDQEALNQALNEGESTPEAPSVVDKIKVGEREYTQDELSSLVSLGEMGRELETKWNTKLDRVVPEFTKKSQRLAELEPEYENLKKSLEQNNKPSDSGEELTPEQIQKSKEILKKMGVVLNDDMDQGLTERFEKFYENKRAAEKLVEQGNRYEGEIDGSDGRPKFDKIKVFEYMRDNGVNDMMTAYKIMYEGELDSWKESQLGKARKPAISTNNVSTAGLSKKPEPVKVTRENLLQQVNSILEQE